MPGQETQSPAVYPHHPLTQPPNAGRKVGVSVHRFWIGDWNGGGDIIGQFVVGGRQSTSS